MMFGKALQWVHQLTTQERIMSNKERFQTVLADQYAQLFTLPAYAMSAARYTPTQLADKMTDGLLTGTAIKDGDGIKRTCKALGIKHTYAAIKLFLQS